MTVRELIAELLRAVAEDGAGLDWTVDASSDDQGGDRKVLGIRAALPAVNPARNPHSPDGWVTLDLEDDHG